jgi:hypothetical protein
MHSVGGIGWEHDDHRTAVDVRKFVSLCEGIGAEIDAESVAVREPDRGAIADGLRGISRHGFMGVRPTSFAGVRFDQLGQHLGIDVVALTR